MQNKLDSVLKALPTRPGIYIFRDNRGEVIYIGKASNLRSRVNSYFQQTSKLPEKTQQLVHRIDGIEFVVTESEVAALILECQQIKKFRPHYNVLLKDDKSFPYIKIDVKNPWPTISITRKRNNDGAKYIGRIPSAWSARQTFDIIKKIFPLRSCNKQISGKEIRPCLKYHIKRCLSPCTGLVSEEEYRNIVRQVVAFLEGKEEQVLRELKDKMNTASANLQFEKAALLRDQINSIQAVIESHAIPFNVTGEVDAIALARDNGLACVQLFSINDRKLKQDEHYIMQGIGSEDDSQILESFVKQYYSSSVQVPKSIFVS
jgi:excinuclease ABC subunit C